MSEKVEIEYVNNAEYRIYNLAIEQLAKIVTELGFAIGNCNDLEDRGYDMNTYKLQDAMVDIATVFAGAVAGLKYIKPKESEVRDGETVM